MIYTDDIHVVADTLDELHTWAKAWGISKSFYEGVRKGHPHYDIPANMRILISDSVRIKHTSICRVTKRELLIKSKALLK